MQMREVSITNWENLELHDLCSMFPEMGEEDFDSLLDSMKNNGFLSTDPIVLIWNDDEDEWLILDGQNRFLAASQAKKTPTFVQYKGDDPLGFVIARNMDRRHLNTGQKAAIAVQIAAMGTLQADAAKQAGVGEASLRRFKFIQERDPKLADKVASGEVKMEKARKRIHEMEQNMPQNDMKSQVEVLGDEGGHFIMPTGELKYKLGDKRKDKLAKMTKVEVTIHAKFQVIFDPDKTEYPDQLAKAIAALEKGGLAEVEVINEGDG